MLSYEGIGKNIEKAIEDALLNLKAPREDVDIKILDEGGLFRKAKVLVSISEDMIEKYQTKAERAKAETKEIKKESVQEPKKEPANKQLMDHEEVKEFLTKKAKPVEMKKETVAAEKPAPKKEKTSRPKPAEENSGEGKGLEFLKGFMKVLDIEGTVNVNITEEKKTYEISGEKVGKIVGYRGECLNALQYITSIIEHREEDESKKIVLDIDGYREKREQTLIALAQRMAKKVAKTNHSVKLEPMAANERRIIHTALHDDEFVTTVSKGMEPNRFLIIVPKDKNNQTSDSEE